MSQGAKTAAQGYPAGGGGGAGPAASQAKPAQASLAQQPSFLGGLFNKRERKLSHTEELGQHQQQPNQSQQQQQTAAGATAAAPYGRTTEV